MDSFEVFDRAAGEKPLLLLDGHHSRMDLEFLEYVNDDKHPWNVNIGVPYGTHIWQVADSSQDNGLFKLKPVETKREYNKLKGLESLTMSDIVPLVNTAFDSSFRLAHNTRTAIKERGWGPALNYCLLLDKRLSDQPKEQSTVATVAETIRTTSTTSASTRTVNVSELEFNNSEGFAALVTDKMIEDRSRQEGRIRAADERVRRMQNRQQHIELIKKLT
jgi:hypothetical protein